MMNWTRKTKALAIAAIAVIAFGIFTAVEYAYEPEAWNPDPSNYSHYVIYKNYTITWPNNTTETVTALNKLSLYNFSEFGSQISLGYWFFPSNGDGSITSIYCITASVGLFMDIFWIQSETLAWPYQAVAIEIDSTTLSVNGTYLNEPNFNENNVLQYSNETSYFSVQNGIINGYYYQLHLGYINDPPYASAFVNPGNYTFTFSMTFTPVFEAGPYFISGPEQTITYRYAQQVVDVQI